MLFNLVSNAVKFTPEGGADPHQDGRASATASRWSSRIPASASRPPALDKLGRPFEQVQSPLTRSHKGSGLGLAISRSLVALHGGDMRIVSTEGVGTKVTVFFPFRPAAARPRPKPPPDRSPDGHAEQRLRAPRLVAA